MKYSRCPKATSKMVIPTIFNGNLSKAIALNMTTMKKRYKGRLIPEIVIVFNLFIFQTFLVCWIPFKILDSFCHIGFLRLG